MLTASQPTPQGIQCYIYETFPLGRAGMYQAARLGALSIVNDAPQLRISPENAQLEDPDAVGVPSRPRLNRQRGAACACNEGARPALQIPAQPLAQTEDDEETARQDNGF